MNHLFRTSDHPNIFTRASFLKLNQPLEKTNHGRKILSRVAPNIWNSLLNSFGLNKGL